MGGTAATSLNKFSNKLLGKKATRLINMTADPLDLFGGRAAQKVTDEEELQAARRMQVMAMDTVDAANQENPVTIKKPKSTIASKAQAANKSINKTSSTSTKSGKTKYIDSSKGLQL